MDWRFNGLISCHELVDGNEIIARIYQAERAKVAYPFRTRSLISALFYGEQRLDRLARHGKEWVSQRRDFRTEDERKRYLERRKQVITRFIAARQRELG